MNNKVAIIVDSSSNLTDEDLRVANIYSLPLLINYEDGTTIEDTPKNVIASNFYHRVASGEYTKTSQSSPGVVSNLWSHLLQKGYEQIIFFPIAKGLSGQYQTALMLTDEPEFKDKVYVVDTDGAATFNSYLALKTREILDANGTLEDVKKMIAKAKKNRLIYIIPEDISRLSKGGRAKAAIISLISLIRIKITIRFDEISERSAISRTLHNAIEAALNNIKKFIKKKRYILEILTSNCTKKVEVIINSIINDHPDLKIKRTILPNCFVSHAGVNSVALIVVRE